MKDRFSLLIKSIFSFVACAILILPASSVAEDVQIVPGKMDAVLTVAPSGNLEYSIPIDAPSGTAQMRPSLSLEYRSSVGNGLLGKGWSISGIGTIARCGASRLFDGYVSGVKYNEQDKLCLNGSRLVLTKGVYGQSGSEYRLEINSNQKVVAHGAQEGSPEYFIVHQPDGRKYYYGNSHDSRIEFQNSDLIRLWSLERVIDPNGNYIQFKYQEDTSNGEFFPTEILYTGNEQLGLEPYNSIEFIYSSRPDPEYQCYGGYLVQTSRRLKEVRVVKDVPTNANGSTGEKQGYKTYQLAYNDGAPTSGSTIDANTCNDNISSKSEAIQSYESLLQVGFDDNLARMNRRQSLENIVNAGRASLVPVQLLDKTPLQILLSVVESNNSSLGESSAQIYGAIKSSLDEYYADFSARFSTMDEPAKVERMAELEAREAVLLNEIASSGGKTKEQIEAEIQDLWKAQQVDRDSLVKILKKEIEEAHDIIVFSHSKKKRAAFELLKSRLRIKVDTATSYALECAVLLDNWGSVEEGHTSVCQAQTTLEAAENFQKYRNGSLVYSDLLSAVSDLEPIVDKAEHRKIAHPVFAGQVAALYERFALKLLREYGVQSQQDLARKAKPLYEELNQLEAQSLLAGLNLERFDGDGNQEFRRSELESIRLEIGLLTAEDQDAYYQDYLAGVQAQVVQPDTSANARYQHHLVEYGMEWANAETVDDDGKNQEFLFLVDQINQTASRDFVALQDRLYYGSIASSRAQKNSVAGDILPQSRITSITECGSDGKCVHPVNFAWNQDALGWSSSPSPESLPDVMFSYGEISATEAGLSVDLEQVIGSDEATADVSSADLTDEQRALARLLARSGNVVDVNGDGLSDWVLALKGDQGVDFKGTWLNTGAGWNYSEKHELPVFTTNTAGTKFGLFKDINKDGFVDWLGGVQLINGETIANAYLGSDAGWVSSPMHILPRSIFVETSDGYRQTGVFVDRASSELSWVEKAQNGESQHFVLAAQGWQNQPGTVPFRTSIDESLVKSGVAVDVNNDGSHEWYQYQTDDQGNSTLEAWQLSNGNWVRSAELDIYIGQSNQFGTFVDLNGDGLKDWVLSVRPTNGEMLQAAQLNIGNGWQDYAEFRSPQITDENLNVVGYLTDINADGNIDWVSGIHGVDGSAINPSQSFIAGEWQTLQNGELPIAISEYLSQEQLQHLGEFANLNGQGHFDWLNLTEIWSQSDAVLLNEQSIVSGNIWAASSEFRLPVLEAGWISNLSDSIRELKELAHESVAQELDAVGDNGEAAGSYQQSNSDVTNQGPSAQELSKSIADGTSNSVASSSQLIDVDGDGRLDWVKAIRFNEVAQQRVVWLRKYNGWEQSTTFVPPAPLIDFTRSTNVSIVDLDADGLPDFLNSISIDGEIVNQYWRNTGSAWEMQEDFTMPLALVEKLGGNTALRAVLVDVNVDGLIDIVPTAGNAAVLVNNGIDEGWSEPLNGDFQLPFSISISGEGNSSGLGYFVEVDGDGLPDWLEYRPGGDRLWTNTGRGWYLENQRLPVSLRAENGDTKALLIDLNSDGLKDILLSYKPYDGVAVSERGAWLNTGTAWKASHNHKLPSDLFHAGKGQAALLADINGDGFVDFIQKALIDGTLIEHALLGTGESWDAAVNIEIPSVLAESNNGQIFINHFTLIDINGNQELDLVKASGDVSTNAVFKAIASIDGTVRSIDNGVSHDIVVYSKGFNPYVTEVGPRDVFYPIAKTPSRQSLVAALSSYESSGYSETEYRPAIGSRGYFYSGAAVDLHHGIGLGFREIESTDWLTSRTAKTLFRQDYPFVGRPSKAEAGLTSGLTLSVNDLDYEDISGADQTYSTPFLKTSITNNYKASGDLLNTIIDEFTPDSDNYGLTVESKQKLIEGDHVFHTTISNAFDHDLAAWNFQRLKKETTTKKIGDDQATEKTRIIERTYYPGTSQLRTETIFGNSKRFIYDDFGNVTKSILGEGSGIVPRSAVNVYDEKGRFLIQSENELGERTRYEYLSVSDEPTKITLNDGNYTSFTYNSLGQQDSETARGGAVTQIVKQFCVSTDNADKLGSGCPEAAKYLFAQITDAARAPEVVYYDSIGREIRRTSSSARGIVQIDTVYNPKGQVLKRTVPYNPDSSTEVRWVSFEYDVLGRTTRVTKPGFEIKDWVYDGRIKIEYDELDQATTTELTHFGTPAAIKDAYGNITTYRYDAFGQLTETIDATGNNIIKVAYDDLGNKISVDDPDHGLTKYEYNVFGQVTLKKDALDNTEKYFYDEWGRLESRIDSGFDVDGNALPDVTTTWVYYELSEADKAYDDYIKTLQDRGLSEAAITELELSKPEYLNVNAHSSLVKEVRQSEPGKSDHVTTTTYDYLARAVSKMVSLPNGEARTLETEYLGETSLPWRMRYPNNFSVQYNYSDDGYLTSVTNGGLNTFDHYQALNERASFLSDNVLKELTDRDTHLRETVLPPLRSRYQGINRDAIANQSLAISHQNHALQFLEAMLDETGAINYLTTDLLTITGANESDERNNAIEALWNKYRNNGHLRDEGACTDGEPRYYDLNVPAYQHPQPESSVNVDASRTLADIGVELENLERQGRIRQEEVDRILANAESNLDAIAQQPQVEPQEPLIVSEDKVINIELPTVCSPGIVHTRAYIDEKKSGVHPSARQGLEQRRYNEMEVQMRSHIIAMLYRIRARRDQNEQQLDAKSTAAQGYIDKAIELNERATNYYDQTVAPVVQRINDIRDGSNALVLKINNVLRKAQRVYQFYEVEQNIEFWAEVKSDETNRVLEERYGNGVATTRSYNEVTGRLYRIEALTRDNRVVQDDLYTFDGVGNLTNHSDRAYGVSMSYDYDRLNRLTNAKYIFNAEQLAAEQSFAYDEIGNITHKSDVGDYSYDPNHPHAVKTAGNRNYSYDAVGRMRGADESLFSYTSFSKPLKISEGSGDFVEYAYGPTRARYYQKNKIGDVENEKFYFFNGLYEESKSNGVVTPQVSISVAGKTIAVLSGANHLFASPTEIPDLGAANDLADEIEQNVQSDASAPPLRSLFNAFDNVLNAVDLVAQTGEDNDVTLSESEFCSANDETFEVSNRTAKSLKEDIEAQYESLKERLGEDALPASDTQAAVTSALGVLADHPQSAVLTEQLYIDIVEAAFNALRGEHNSLSTVVECLSQDQEEQVKEVYAASLINLQYFHYDHLDSVKVITDSAGELITVNLFDAFGSPLLKENAQPVSDDESGSESSSEPSEQANSAIGGHEPVAGTELVHMGGRIYDPVIGRFVSADPFVPASFEPQALNRYSYVYNNPLKYTDPTGYRPISARQHERNEWIFVALSIFFLEIDIPSNNHLYDLLELSRNDPDTFAEHLAAWGASEGAWQQALPFIDAGKGSQDAAKAIRDAKRKKKYLSIATAVITIYTGGVAQGVFEGAAFFGQWYAVPVLNAAATYAITGEFDAGQFALSLATSYVGHSANVSGNPDAANNGFRPLFGSGENSNALIQLGDASTVNAAYRGTRAVLSGVGAELAGGEFFHAFGASLAGDFLNDKFDFNVDTSLAVEVIGSGFIEGIIVEISNETRNGERLDFFDGFQRGAIRVFANRAFRATLNVRQRNACYSDVTSCRSWGTAYGDIFNLVISGVDSFDLLPAIAGAVVQHFSFINDIKRYETWRRSQNGRIGLLLGAEDSLLDFRLADFINGLDTREVSELSDQDKAHFTAANFRLLIEFNRVRDEYGSISRAPETVRQALFGTFESELATLGYTLHLNEVTNTYSIAFSLGDIENINLELLSESIESAMEEINALAAELGLDELNIDEDEAIYLDIEEGLRLRVERRLATLEATLVFSGENFEQLQSMLSRFEAFQNRDLYVEGLSDPVSWRRTFDSNGNRRWTFSYLGENVGQLIIDANDPSRRNLLIDPSRLHLLSTGELDNLVPGVSGLLESNNLIQILIGAGADLNSSGLIEIATVDGQAFFVPTTLEFSHRFDFEVQQTLVPEGQSIPTEAQVVEMLDLIERSCTTIDCDLSQVLPEEQHVYLEYTERLLEAYADNVLMGANNALLPIGRQVTGFSLADDIVTRNSVLANSGSSVRIPGVVQSRINVANNRTRFTPLRNSGEPVSAGFEHVLMGHFGRPLANNVSVFSVTPNQLRVILQSRNVVRSPVTYLGRGQYVRTVDVGMQIGHTSLRFGGLPTSRMRIITDRAGNLITTYPVK